MKVLLKGRINLIGDKTRNLNPKHKTKYNVRLYLKTIILTLNPRFMNVTIILSRTLILTLTKTLILNNHNQILNIVVALIMK